MSNPNTFNFFCYVCKVPNCISEGVSRENIEFGLEFGNLTRSHTLPKETKTNFKERGESNFGIVRPAYSANSEAFPTHANVHIQFRYLHTHQKREVYA